MGGTGRRGRKAEQIAATREPTAAREDLERRWRERLVEEPRLATTVTAGAAQREPFHRWIRYRQGFAPALVRVFLRESGATRSRKTVILDPFSGAGTTAVECARNSIRAVALDAVPALAFLTAMKWVREFPSLPSLGDFNHWAQVADQLVAPIHRAALMLAVARQHTAGGQLHHGGAPLGKLLGDVAAMIREDQSQPLSVAGLALPGDARKMDMIDDASIAGILTSPPYLSRYDYREATAPYEELYRHWYGPRLPEHGGQLQASSSTTSRHRRAEVSHAAIQEACECLIRSGHAPTARVIGAYAADMQTVLAELHRVLRIGSPCWMVVGGARLKDVYVPADLIIAELAEGTGFVVELVRVARELIPARRKFGRIGHISPRESVLVMRRV